MLVIRYISSVLAIFLVLSAVLFFLVIRNSSKAELFRHEGMLAVHFSIYAIVYFVVDVGWTKALLVNRYMLWAFTLCLIIWIIAFNPHRALANEGTLGSVRLQCPAVQISQLHFRAGNRAGR